MVIFKTIAAALVAGAVYTILMGMFFKRQGIDPKRKYISGITFAIAFFLVLLILKVF